MGHRLLNHQKLRQSISKLNKDILKLRSNSKMDKKGEEVYSVQPKTENQKLSKEKSGEKVYKAQSVKNDVLLFGASLIVFQCVELFVMFTITMSNERMNLDAPVLYDSILSAIPKKKAAGKISEITLFVYQLTFITFMVFHTRRFAIARRCLTIQSVCFIFRIICVWANVLPRSTYAMECSPKATGTEEIISRVLLLWSAAGLSIFGGHMCGNYFFSGHALMATIIYHHFGHYMPPRWCLAHKLNALVALSIGVLILLAHNHYTLDIVGSVIVGDWVFKLYTFIAETKEVNSAEWFPVFWRPMVEFFEREKEVIEY